MAIPNMPLLFLLLSDIQKRRSRRRRAVAQAVAQVEARRLRRKKRIWRYRTPLRYRRGSFDLDSYDDPWCLLHLRFTKEQIRKILPYLRLDRIEYRFRYKASPEVAFCLLLYKLSYPNRYNSSLNVFGHSKSWQCTVFLDTIQYITKRYRGMMYWDPSRLTKEKLSEYAAAIEKKSGVAYVWGFVDGTIRRMCRPTPEVANQRYYYTGYKRFHGFKFQAISTPDGLVSSLAGPTTAADGDWLLWQESLIEGKIRELFEGVSARQVPKIYGDPAYSGSYGVIGAFKRQIGKSLTPEQEDFNTTMSSVRISIEQIFGLTIRLWAMNEVKSLLKTGLSPVGSFYIVSIFLTNCYTCLNPIEVHDLSLSCDESNNSGSQSDGDGDGDGAPAFGNQVTRYFRCPPPTIDKYLRGISDGESDEEFDLDSNYRVIRLQ